MSTSDTLASVIRLIRKQRKMTIQQFADSIDWDVGNVSRIERGKQEITQERLKLISKALYCPISDLYYYADVYEKSGESYVIQSLKNLSFNNIAVNETVSQYNLPDHKITIANKVPLISWVQAGDWEEVIDTLEPGDGDDWIPTTAQVGPHAYALLVNGDSMEPEFPNGSTIIVDPDAAIVHNAYVIVRLNESNEATFKQYIDEGGNKFLKPLNPRYPIIEIKESATFCGRVVMLEKKYL